MNNTEIMTFLKRLEQQKLTYTETLDWITDFQSMSA